jgi:UPF0716 protein FxsA
LLWIFVVIVIVLPILELWGLLTVGQLIGTIPTILLVILTGVLGIHLARQQGFKTFRTAQEQIMRGEPPGEAILDGICILIGGILLFIPGLFTDVIGLVLLIPLTRKGVKILLFKGMEKMVQRRMYRP